MARFILLSLLLLAQPALAADREPGLVFGRGSESADTDILRLTYRRALEGPDEDDQQRRHARAVLPRVRLASRYRRTVGQGLQPRVGVQHLSNAGLKQPNGGINLWLLTSSVRF